MTLRQLRQRIVSLVLGAQHGITKKPNNKDKPRQQHDNCKGIVITLVYKIGATCGGGILRFVRYGKLCLQNDAKCINLHVA